MKEGCLYQNIKTKAIIHITKANKNCVECIVLANDGRFYTDAWFCYEDNYKDFENRFTYLGEAKAKLDDLFELMLEDRYE